MKRILKITALLFVGAVGYQTMLGKAVKKGTIIVDDDRNMRVAEDWFEKAKP